MSAPSVAVITPVYQGERFLAAALESIRRQSLPAAEVIVVDDGSTDASGAIARSFAAGWPAVRVLSGPNGGLSSALNDGIAAAASEFVTFLDADDVMMHTRLEQQVGHLVADLGADAVMGREEILVEKGAVAPPWIRAEADGRPRPYMMSLMVRRAVLDRVGGFDPALDVSQDLDWMVRARAAGVRVDTLDAVLIQRRMHGDNMVYETGAIRRGMLRAMRSRLAAREASS